MSYATPPLYNVNQQTKIRSTDLNLPTDNPPEIFAGFDENGTAKIRRIFGQNGITVQYTGDNNYLDISLTGGPGVTTFAALSDVEVTPQQPNQALHYDAVTSKWVQTPELVVDSASRNVIFATTGSINLECDQPMSLEGQAEIAVTAIGNATIESSTGTASVIAPAGAVEISADTNVSLITGTGNVVVRSGNETQFTTADGAFAGLRVIVPDDLTTMDIAASGSYLAPNPTSLITRAQAEGLVPDLSGYAKTDASNTGIVSLGNNTNDEVAIVRNGSAVLTANVTSDIFVNGRDITTTATRDVITNASRHVNLTATDNADLRSNIGTATLSSGTGNARVISATGTASLSGRLGIVESVNDLTIRSVSGPINVTADDNIVVTSNTGDIELFTNGVSTATIQTNGLITQQIDPSDYSDLVFNDTTGSAIPNKQYVSAVIPDVSAFARVDALNTGQVFLGNATGEFDGVQLRRNGTYFIEQDGFGTTNVTSAQGNLELYSAQNVNSVSGQVTTLSSGDNPTLKLDVNGLITQEIDATAYANLVTTNNAIPNKKYVDDTLSLNVVPPQVIWAPGATPSTFVKTGDAASINAYIASNAALVSLVIVESVTIDVPIDMQNRVSIINGGNITVSFTDTGYFFNCPSSVVEGYAVYVNNGTSAPALFSTNSTVPWQSMFIKDLQLPTDGKPVVEFVSDGSSVQIAVVYSNCNINASTQPTLLVTGTAANVAIVMVSSYVDTPTDNWVAGAILLFNLAIDSTGQTNGNFALPTLPQANSTPSGITIQFTSAAELVGKANTGSFVTNPSTVDKWLEKLNTDKTTITQVNSAIAAQTLANHSDAVITPLPANRVHNSVIAWDTTTQKYIDDQDGWVDLLGTFDQRSAGGGALPFSLTQFDVAGRVWEWASTNGAGQQSQAYITYHWPHDYSPGTDTFIHIHHSVNQSVTTTASFQVWAAFARSGSVFPALKQLANVTHTYAGAGDVRKHIVTEIPLSTVGGVGATIDTADLETDGILQVYVFYQKQLAPDTMGNNTPTFVHFVDVHYKSTGRPTKNKVSPFNT